MDYPQKNIHKDCYLCKYAATISKSSRSWNVGILLGISKLLKYEMQSFETCYLRNIPKTKNFLYNSQIINFSKCQYMSNSDKEIDYLMGVDHPYHK